jgi:hypothetical protein
VVAQEDSAALMAASTDERMLSSSDVSQLSTLLLG